MQLYAFIGTFFRGQTDDSMFEKLLNAYPEGGARMRNNGFKLFLPADDPRTRNVLDVLKAHGLQPTHFGMTTAELRDQRRYYQLSLHREYTAEDLDQHEYFELRAPSEAGMYSVDRRPDGTLTVPEIAYPDDLHTDDWDFFGDATLNHWHIVPDRVRDILVSANFTHQLLLPVEAEPPPNPQPGVRSYWEVTSNFVLPPVSPTMVLLAGNGKRVWPGRPTGGQRIEGLYNHAELHYRASDLRALEPFDVARTFESFWGPDDNQRRPDDCPLVVSKRFYSLCRKHNFKVAGTPSTSTRCDLTCVEETNAQLRPIRHRPSVYRHTPPRLALSILRRP